MASILPLCVAWLTYMMRRDDGNNDINYARQEEIDAAYRAIFNGGCQLCPRTRTPSSTRSCR